MSVLVFSCFCFSPAFPQTVNQEQASEDIEILKVLNLFDFTQEQYQKLAPILKNGRQMREKNLNEIRDALMQGKKYGDLSDTYLTKLSRTNSKIVTQIEEILAPEQKEKAQMIFDLVTDSEMGTITGTAPAIIKMITSRLSLLKDLGVVSVSDEMAGQMMGPLAQMLLEAFGRMQNKVREKILSKLTSPKAIAIVEQKAKMPKKK